MKGRPGELPAVPDFVKPRQRMLGFPNFRDYGMTVDHALLRVVGSLSKKHGESFASEGGFRRLVYEDIGHMAGVDTVRRALERLERRGLIEQRWLLPGGVLPDGSVCTHGTRLVVPVVTKRQRDWQRARRANRRHGVTNRYEPRMAETLKQATAAIAREKAPPPVDDAARLARKREDDLRRLRELEASWGPPAADRKPPE